MASDQIDGDLCITRSTDVVGSKPELNNNHFDHICSAGNAPLRCAELSSLDSTKSSECIKQNQTCDRRESNVHHLTTVGDMSKGDSKETSAGERRTLDARYAMPSMAATALDANVSSVDDAEDANNGIPHERDKTSQAGPRPCIHCQQSPPSQSVEAQKSSEWSGLKLPGSDLLEDSACHGARPKAFRSLFDFDVESRGRTSSDDIELPCKDSDDLDIEDKLRSWRAAGVALRQALTRLQSESDKLSYCLGDLQVSEVQKKDTTTDKVSPFSKTMLSGKEQVIGVEKRKALVNKAGCHCCGSTANTTARFPDHYKPHDPRCHSRRNKCVLITHQNGVGKPVASAKPNEQVERDVRMSDGISENVRICNCLDLNQVTSESTNRALSEGASKRDGGSEVMIDMCMRGENQIPLEPKANSPVSTNSDCIKFSKDETRMIKQQADDKESSQTLAELTQSLRESFQRINANMSGLGAVSPRKKRRFSFKSSRHNTLDECNSSSEESETEDIQKHKCQHKPVKGARGVCKISPVDRTPERTLKPAEKVVGGIATKDSEAVQNSESHSVQGFTSDNLARDQSCSDLNSSHVKSAGSNPWTEPEDVEKNRVKCTTLDAVLQGKLPGLVTAESVADLADVESCTDGELSNCRSDSDMLGIRSGLLQCTDLAVSDSKDEQGYCGVFGLADLQRSADNELSNARDASLTDSPSNTRCILGQTCQKQQGQRKDNVKASPSTQTEGSGYDLEPEDFAELDLADLSTQSSDTEMDAQVRITEAEIDSLFYVHSEHSESSVSGGEEADDEFECECLLCQAKKDKPPSNEEPLLESLRDHTEDFVMGEEDDRDLLYFSGDSENFGHPFTVDLPRLSEQELLLMRLGTHDTLESMFQNVIMQMLSVYPELLNEQAPPPLSAKTFDKIPELRIEEKHICDEVTCPICLCNFQNGEDAKKLPCQHLFHSLCIRAWLNKCGTCPVCRHALT